VLPISTVEIATKTNDETRQLKSKNALACGA